MTEMTGQSPEEMFPPKPGGMVDTARKQAQAEQSQLDALPETDPGDTGDFPAIRVRDEAAELARARTFSVSTANNNPIVELLGRDDNRRNAVIMTLDQPVVISFSQQAAEDPRNHSAGTTAVGAASQASVEGSGSITDPTFDFVIATSFSVPPGTYQVTATVYLSGTVTAADANNMFLSGTGTATPTIIYPGVVNTPVVYTATFTSTGAGGFGVKTINAASGASAIYNASIVVTPVNTAATGTTGSSANGFVLPVNVPLTLNTKSAIYCTATSATASRVSVAGFSDPES